jgi:hypothetical protein
MKVTLTHRVYTHDDGTVSDVYDADVDDNEASILIHGFKLDYEIWRPLGSELEFVVRKLIPDEENERCYKTDENLKPLSLDQHKHVKSVTIEFE